MAIAPWEQHVEYIKHVKNIKVASVEDQIADYSETISTALDSLSEDLECGKANEEDVQQVVDVIGFRSKKTSWACPEDELVHLKNIINIF